MNAVLALLAAVAAHTPPKSPEAIWRSACSYCHQGSKVAPAVPRGIDAATVRQFVRNGINAMPPFHRSEISEAELDGLAAWLNAGGQDEVKPR